MTTINILGDCVSRDIVTPLINKNKVNVKRFQSFTNPISLLSKKASFQITVNDIRTDDNNFRKRCAANDINKSGLNYVLTETSDYIIADFLDARLPILNNDGHLITLSNCIINAKSILNEKFNICDYKELSPFDDIDFAQWESTIITICNLIKKHYSPEKIILNKHFGANYYMHNDELIPYVKYLPFIRKFNQLVSYLFSVAEKELTGCHIIEFPDNVLGDANHQWGLYPLHYHSLYYDYGARALDIILQNLSQSEEKIQLNALQQTYSDLFNELKNTLNTPIIENSYGGGGIEFFGFYGQKLCKVFKRLNGVCL